ncbi:MAG: tyrosine-protein phosphatase [Planctomycetes bacterium]|nr:tyrosine-protein phosphatase [Planctomycetota bacterium]
MTRRRAFLLLLVLSSVAAIPLLGGVYRGHHLRNFHVVEPGVLYRSGQLTPTGLDWVLRKYRIKTVVTLRTVRDPGRPYLDAWEEEVCAGYGAKHIRILPRVWSPDTTGVAPADKVVQEFLAVVGDTANQPILVHCFAGVHRTGAMCAAFRMDLQGWPAERAIEEMRDCGFQPGTGNDAIEDYLRAFQPRARSSAELGGQ